MLVGNYASAKISADISVHAVTQFVIVHMSFMQAC